MKFIITGKNIEVTNALKEKIHEKVGRLEKFFAHETNVHATMSVQKNTQIFEVTIPFNRMVFKAVESHSDMYASIDKAVDSLERQIVRNKSRFSKKGNESKLKHPEIIWDQAIQTSEKDDVKEIAEIMMEVKPMSADEAVLQLGVLEQQFLMFLNADSKKINVLYRKNDGNFGLLVPEI